MPWFTRRIAKQEEFDEEIRAHFALEVQRRVEAGETPEEAELAARRLFGNVGLVKEVTRAVWGWAWLDAFTQDVKYSIRLIAKAPGFAAIAILTLALAVGATTAVFSVANSILLQPLPYPEPNRILTLWRLAPVANVFGVEDFPWGRADFGLFVKETKTFQSLGAFQPDTFNLTGSSQPVFLEGMRASAGFFPTLGINPALGRFFTAQEDQKGHEHVVVLSDALWRERFGADRNIVGRSIELSAFTYTVIGVAPPGFSFPHAEEMPPALEFPAAAQLWVPLAISPGERGPSELAVIGRMRPHITMLQVQAELNVFAHTLERTFPNAKNWSRSRARPLEKQIVGDSRRPLILLLGAVGLVLAIACSNIAGLLLTRSLSRRREFSVRAALGAAHSRLIRQLMTESSILSFAGGILGIALAASAVQLLKKYGPTTLPRLHEVSVDAAVFAFCFALTLLAGVFLGIAPSFSATKGHGAAGLRSGTRIAGSGFSAQLRHGLLIAQVAVAFVLVIAAGLLVRTFYSLLNADSGFKVERVLTFEISLPDSQYPDSDHMAQLYTRALHTLETIPGVQSVGMVHAVPMGGAPDATSIRIPGRTLKPDEQPFANYMFTSPGYFNAVRTPLLRGRDFRDSDTLAAMPVTVINRAMAKALWPGQDALGKQVGVATIKYPVRTIVGVVADVKQTSLREETAPQMYVPFTQSEIKGWPPMRTMQVALRTAYDPATITQSVRRAMKSVDPALPLAKVATLSELVDRSLTQPRFVMLLIAAFGALSLLLASVGMYGAISYSVTQRTQEIGIRMALGAERVSVFAMVVKQGLGLAVLGLALGLLGAFGATRALSSFLYGVRPFDPLTFAGGCALFAALVVLACWIPAQRATRVDPAVTLRQDSI